ncbi:MAG: F0F1 ATP synthase subunit B [Candidatus Limnocylindrales bacterium]
MDPLAVAQILGRDPFALAAETTGGGLTINFFWIIVSALNFIVFLAIIWAIFFKPVANMLGKRRSVIEQGLKDADVARREREAASDEKQAILHEARREASETVARAQKVADEAREREVAKTRDEIARLRDQATAEIQAEKERALSEVRGQIADLALQAAGKVVGETRTSERERRLVEQFLREVGPVGPAERN